MAEQNQENSSEGIVFSEESLLQLINHCKTSSKSGYVLPAASADTLGGVKVGSGLAIDSSGTLSTSGGNLTLIQSGVSSHPWAYLDDDALGNHKKLLVVIRNDNYFRDPVFTFYLDLDIYSALYPDGGTMYINVGGGVYKSNNNESICSLSYEINMNNKHTITLGSAGEYFTNLEMGHYWVYALDGGSDGGSSSAVMDYSTSEIPVGSYFGQTYYKRSFILNEDYLCPASTWVLLNDKYGIPSSFGTSITKIVGYELTVDNTKINNMSGFMYGDAGEGTGFYALLQYAETYRENESVLTIYYTK